MKINENIKYKIVLPIGLAATVFTHEIECAHIAFLKPECANKHVEVEVRPQNYSSFDKGIAVASGTQVSTIDINNLNHRNMYRQGVVETTSTDGLNYFTFNK